MGTVFDSSVLNEIKSTESTLKSCYSKIAELDNAMKSCFSQISTLEEKIKQQNICEEYKKAAESELKEIKHLLSNNQNELSKLRSKPQGRSKFFKIVSILSLGLITAILYSLCFFQFDIDWSDNKIVGQLASTEEFIKEPTLSPM